FGTGQWLTGIDRLVEAAHRRGALVLVDAYHAAGVIPMDLERLGADFAIGGSYKYTRGGPGAGWLAIHPRHLDGADRPLTLDTGWFAKDDVFAFRRDERPRLAPGGDAWLENTPVVLTAYQARAGLELTLALGVERLRAYSLEQQAHLADALRRRGLPLREFEPRGAFMLVPRPDARALCARLKQAGVNTDARGPYVRLCPDILNTQDEMDRAAEIIGRA